MTRTTLPHYASGEIIKGFGRGSKQLGIPTANYPDDVVEKLPEDLPTGIYFGFAQLDGVVYEMVISIGWNPFYKNERKSMETHLLHEFEGDLYGKILKIVIVGYLRPELNFNSLDELKKAIRQDIQNAHEGLQRDEFKQYRNDSYFNC